MSLGPRLALALVLAMPTASAIGQDSAETGPPDRDASGRPADPGAEDRDRPVPLDRFFRAIDPARVQRALDRILGFDTGDRSDRPEAPEIGEPVFFDNVRPLGDRKYANEFNYLLNASTRNSPTLQVLEYEYVLSDWNAVELDLSYFNGNLQLLTPFYQRTLGVGRDRNWVHGVQLSPDIYLRSHFLGGSAVYMLGWKPREDSKFSTLTFLGANRALIGGFAPPGVRGPVASGLATLRRPDDEPTFGAWRPTVNVNLFYQITEKVTLGIENDLFIHPGKAGEYLSFPFLTYKPGGHAFFQVGGGYYRFESVDQFTVFAHLNFVNDSPRKARDRDDDRPREESGGPIHRCLDRLLGDR